MLALCALRVCVRVCECERVRLCVRAPAGCIPDVHLVRDTLERRLRSSRDDAPTSPLPQGRAIEMRPSAAARQRLGSVNQKSFSGARARACVCVCLQTRPNLIDPQVAARALPSIVLGQCCEALLWARRASMRKRGGDWTSKRMSDSEEPGMRAPFSRAEVPISAYRPIGAIGRPGQPKRQQQRQQTTATARPLNFTPRGARAPERLACTV